ncbi:MAG TPA: type II secretion system protein [Rubrivivax sp.]|nr:type II secretion system protein [Rubrivivax sp.]
MKARGFTLVEMLVTLALVALVSSLLWQALATVARIEAQLARTRTLSNDEQLRRAWVEQALSGVMTGPQGDPLRFSGSAMQISSYTTMPPWPGSLGPELMRLEIERSGGGQRLIVRRPGTDAPLELWRWAGAEGRFDYLDAAGRWHDAWPAPDAARPEPLPAAVRVLGPPAGAVLVAVMTTQGQMLRQQDLLSDSPGGR